MISHCLLPICTLTPSRPHLRSVKARRVDRVLVCEEDRGEGAAGDMQESDTCAPPDIPRDLGSCPRSERLFLQTIPITVERSGGSKSRLSCARRLHRMQKSVFQPIGIKDRQEARMGRSTQQRTMSATQSPAFCVLRTKSGEEMLVCGPPCRI